MPTFRYSARQDGEPVTGELEAASAEAAAQILASHGLQVEQVELATSTGSVHRLTRDESVELGGRIAEVVRSGLPLVSGLQALHAEIPSGRVRRALRRMIQRLEAGEPVEQVIAADDPAVPAQVPAMIRAGLRTGKLGVLLEQYLGRARESIERRWQVALGLAYPVILLAVGMLILTFFAVYLIPEFKSLYADFAIELPGLTLFVISVSDALTAYGWTIVLGLLVLLAIFLVSMPSFGGRNALRRWVYRIPFIGTPLRFSAVAEFCHLLAILVEGDEPLANSLRVCGGASHSPDLQHDSRILAEDVERGIALHAGARGLPAFPPELVAFFRWSHDRDAFVQALRAAGDIFDARSRSQVGVVAVALEPFVVFAVVGIVAGTSTALFLPLIKLLNELS